jgi:hypothetical protein
MLAPASRGGEANMGLAEDELRAIEARWLSPGGRPDDLTAGDLLDQGHTDIGLLVAEIRRLQGVVQALDRP